MKTTKRALQIGDTIRCHDPEDMVETDQDLIRGGYEAEFVYELDGKKGYWLEITEVPE